MIKGKFFIHATNVHQGGGKALLWSVIKSLPSQGLSVLVLDSRMALPDDLPENIQVKKVSPTILQRTNAELWLSRNVQSQDVVLCFGNLPPLFRLRGRAVVFVQNRYLIDDVPLRSFPLGVKLRLTIERLWLSSRMANASEFIVQTPTMQKLLEKKVRYGVPVRVLPFVAKPEGYTRGAQHKEMRKEREYDFIYVASGEPHKNHIRLLDAWCLLAEEGVFPSLCLTLDEVRFADLCCEIKALRDQYGLKIINVGELMHQGVVALYKNASAAIYPSTFESFGLPLIEARQAGLPVLAAELDYVRDVLDPEQSFDPESSVSIARAVKRFMGREEQALPVLDAQQFMDSVLGKAK